MRTAFIAACVVVSGCAGMQQQQAMEKSSESLCLEVLNRPRFRDAAINELRRRNHQCDWDLAKAQAQIENHQDDRRIGLSQQLINQGQPRAYAPAPAQPARSLNCTSYRDATGAIRTDCF